MLGVILQMAALIGCGVVWRMVGPGGADAPTTRKVLTNLVYYLFLPALVLLVLWQAPLGADAAKIAATAAGSVLSGVVLAWIIYRLLGTPAAERGALILAAAFPNATYLGLPVLEKTLGPWARSIAIEYDLFACTPLLLTVGVLIARAHGNAAAPVHPLAALLKVPPLWATVGAVALNLAGIPLPAGFKDWLAILGGAVVPLMLVALGLSLRWDTLRLRHAPLYLPALALQLLFLPFVAWGLARLLGLDGAHLTAVTLEAAMPSMVLGVVVCDQYGLHTGLFAAAVTVTTLASILSLPLWFAGLA